MFNDEWVAVALLPLALRVNPAESEPKMALAVRLPAPPAVAMQGPSLTIAPYVVAGGGGTSTGGGFTLDGTIGQAAAGGPVSAGSFSINAGFWEAVSTPSASKKRGGQLTSQ